MGAVPSSVLTAPTPCWSPWCRVPVVVNPYSSSFFASAAGAPAPGGSTLVAPTPTRTVQVPDPPYPQVGLRGEGELVGGFL